MKIFVTLILGGELQWRGKWNLSWNNLFGMVANSSTRDLLSWNTLLLNMDLTQIRLKHFISRWKIGLPDSENAGNLCRPVTRSYGMLPGTSLHLGPNMLSIFTEYGCSIKLHFKPTCNIIRCTNFPVWTK